MAAKVEVNQLSVKDVISCLQIMKHQLKWNELAFQFSLSRSEQAELESTIFDDSERIEEVVRRWLDGGGLKPSWRTLIWILDFLDEINVADQFRNRAEVLNDPSFTVENICSVMTTPNWKEVWSTLLPASRLEKIENECSEVEEQTRACAIVFYSHWNVSWQTLAHSLYIWNHQLILEKLKCFLPPRDPSLTLENMMSVMSNLVHEDWTFVWCQLVPKEQLAVIENKSPTSEERTHFCCSHYVSSCPTASWQDIARKLFHDEEVAAVQKATLFLPPKDPTLTIDQLQKALKEFNAWEELAPHLDITDSVIKQISDDGSINHKKEALFQTFIHDHPCPSWTIVIEGLECIDEHRLANQLRIVYSVDGY